MAGVTLATWECSFVQPLNTMGTPGQGDPGDKPPGWKEGDEGKKPADKPEEEKPSQPAS